MLKFKEAKESISSLVVFDTYIPFSAEFASNSCSQPLYWRVGDGKVSLLEVGLNRESGALLSFTLTNINVEHVRTEINDYLGSENEKEGIPIFDLSAWKKDYSSDDFGRNFFDEFNIDFELKIGSDYLSVSINDSSDSFLNLKNENVIFGFNSKGELNRIDITNLSREDVETVTSAIFE